jgi:hypothetical protein
MKRYALCIILLFQLFCSRAQEKDVIVPYTLADRDRAVRLETRMDALEGKNEEIKVKIDRLEDKFDSYFMWGFGLVLMGIFGLIGFIIYDRRTTLAPVESKTEKIIKVLKDAAERDPELKESLKRMTLW